MKGGLGGEAEPAAVGVVAGLKDFFLNFPFSNGVLSTKEKIGPSWDVRDSLVRDDSLVREDSLAWNDDDDDDSLVRGGGNESLVRDDDGDNKDEDGTGCGGNLT